MPSCSSVSEFVARCLTPPQADREELIDSLVPSEADFRAAFTDVARINRFLGGTRAVLGSLGPLMAAVPTTRPVRVLDIATGSADIPRAFVRTVRAGRWGPGRQVEVVALDNHPKVLQFARSATPLSRYPEIRIKEGDAFALPYQDGAFDIVLCSLAFHHFGFARCVRLINEMERVSGAGWIVNDLVRDRIGVFLAWFITHFTGANHLTRNDAPLSVRRAFALSEYRQMCCDAGVCSATVHAAPMYRAVVRHVKAGQA